MLISIKSKKMYTKIIFLLLTYVFLTMTSLAGVYVEPPKPYQKKTCCCIPTKSKTIPLSERPAEYSHYNNITKPEGGFSNKFINKIIIKGKVTDKNCVPIPNVKINVSQKDEYGVYRFIKAFVPVFEKSYKLNYQQYSTFSGTGTTTTNNRGEFVFITTIPNSRTKDKNRLINITAEHINYPNISTQIFLGRHLDKHRNNVIRAKYSIEREELDRQNLPVYKVDLVLDGVSKYKRY